jgi:hypothetical protein
VAELFPELFGRSFLSFPHFAAVDHHVMRVVFSLDLDLAKFHQSRFHVSMFRWLEFQGKKQDSRLRGSAYAIEHCGLDRGAQFAALEAHRLFQGCE